MSEQPQLHSVIVAMVSLAAGIAANHPTKWQCQLQKLRDYGVPESQISDVVEIARHIRQEAGERLDSALDTLLAEAHCIATAGDSSCGCGTTATGVACC